MTTKQNWLSRITEPIETEAPSISFYSSSSEDESKCLPQKQYKYNSNHWTKLGRLVEDSTTSKDVDCISIYSQYSQITCNTNSSETESTHSGSPVLSAVKYEQLSPVLTSSQYRTEKRKSMSPIISKACSQCCKKHGRRSNPTTKIENLTFYSSDSDCEITNTQSSQSSLSQSYSIEQFCSQYVHSLSTGFSISNNDQFNDTLYCTPPRRKRKRYKKGGLAYQLQQALIKQTTNVDIWKHELYLRGQQELSGDFINKHLILLLSIISSWKEFGVTVVLCKMLLEGDKPCNDSNCLLVIGFNVADTVSLQPSEKLRIFPPYNSKLIDYNNKTLICYINISKLIAEK